MTKASFLAVVFGTGTTKCRSLTPGAEAPLLLHGISQHSDAIRRTTRGFSYTDTWSWLCLSLRPLSKSYTIVWETERSGVRRCHHMGRGWVADNTGLGWPYAPLDHLSTFPVSV